MWLVFFHETFFNHTSENRIYKKMFTFNLKTSTYTTSGGSTTNSYYCSATPCTELASTVRDYSGAVTVTNCCSTNLCNTGTAVDTTSLICYDEAGTGTYSTCPGPGTCMVSILLLLFVVVSFDYFVYVI